MITNQEKCFIEYCMNNNLSGVKTCHKNGVNLFIEDNWAIDIAARNGYFDLARWLLQNGVTHGDAAIKNLLAYACYHKNLPFVYSIIGQSDAYKEDKYAFSWTASTGVIEIGELLLGYLNKEKLGGSFIRAAECGHTDYLDFLIGNSIQDYDKSAKRAAYWAAENGKWPAVKQLIETSVCDIESISEFKEVYLNWLREN